MTKPTALVFAITLALVGCGYRKESPQTTFVPERPLAIPAPRVRVDVPPIPAVERVDIETATGSSAVLERLFDGDETFSLTLEDASFEEVAATLSRHTRRLVVADEGVNARVTMTFANTTLREATASLLGKHGLELRDEGSVVRIVPAALSMAIFHLSMPDAFLTAGYEQLVGAEAMDAWTAIEQALTMVLSPQATFRTDRAGSLIVIRERPDRMDAVERVLEQLVEPRRRQVMIEARLIEVELSDDLEYGIDWQSTDLTGDDSLDASGATDLGPVFNTVNFAVSTSRVTAMLDALGRRGNLNVLSAPRLTTLNRVPARINVTEEVPYYTSEFAGIGNDVVQNVELEFREAGVELELVPTIASGGEIVLALHPVVTEVTGFTESIENLPPNPILDRREVHTIVRARDGESVVLAGMIRRRYTETVEYVPGLGWVPLLGGAFRGVDQEVNRSELVMIITPTIADSARNLAAVDTSLERAEELRRKFTPGPARKGLRADEATP